jgi:hypothetical protein
MSLELAIKENTAAVESLAAYLKNLFTTDRAALALTAHVDTVVDTKVAKTETKTAKSETAPAHKTNLTAKTETQADVAGKSVEAKVEVVTYEELKKAIVAFQQANGREKAIAALASLGVAKGTDLKPEQYAEALVLFTA